MIISTTEGKKTLRATLLLFPKVSIRNGELSSSTFVVVVVFEYVHVKTKNYHNTSKSLEINFIKKNNLSSSVIFIHLKKVR